MIYIFDIDGTLCDLEHRLHHVKKHPKDWDSFFAAVGGDLPIPEVIDVAKALWEAGHTLLLASGRSEVVRDKTARWFRDHSLFHIFSGLYMRKENDHRPDNIVKAEILEEVLKTYKREDIAGIFDDRQQVVDMWRSKGFRVFQVAEGKF